MRNRVLSLCMAALFLFAVAVVSAPAAFLADTHEGLVVKSGGGKLTMTDKDGKNEHSHDVAFEAKITRDGKDCKLDELKKGDRVKVTIEKKEGKEQATRIEAKSS